MITRLLLENWRAYPKLELELPEGTSFVVARNGIGKTSLVQGVAWGLLGEKALKLDLLQAIQTGKPRTRVELDLALPDGRTLTLERSFVVRGRKTEVTASFNGSQIQGDAPVAAEIGRALGADVPHLARLLFMGEGTFAAYMEESFDLRGHLCNVFGVQSLLDASTRAERLAKTAKAEADRIRLADAPNLRLLAELRSKVGEIRRAIEDLEQSRNEKQALLLSAQQAELLARHWNSYDVTIQEQRRAMEAIAQDARVVIDPQLALDALDVALMEAEASTQQALDARRDRLAGLDINISTLKQSLGQLEEAGAECPVCLRPLGEEDAAHARQRHDNELAQLHEARTSLEQDDVLTARLDSVRILRRRLAGIAAPTAPSDPRPSGPALDIAQRQQDLNQVSTVIAERRRELELVTQELSSEESTLAAQTQAVDAYFREGLSSALKSALEETAERIVMENIDPIVSEVARRWKVLMGARGSLQLQADGRLILRQDGHDLEFSSMSGGEKVVAVLLTHMLLTAATTQAGFMWLDEPLEHLDPRNRRIVASTLAQATKTGLRQVLVTTYEDGLARRLALSDPGVNVIAVAGGRD